MAVPPLPAPGELRPELTSPVRRRRPAWSARTRAIALSLAAGIAAGLLSALPAVLPLQESADLFFLFRARGALPPPADVAIVPIDSRAARSIAVPRDAQARAQCHDVRVGEAVPPTHEVLPPGHLVQRWPRCLTGMVIDSLHRAGAAVIVLDVLFRPIPAQPGMSAEQIDEGDRLLAQAMRRADVLLTQRLEGEHDEPAPVSPPIADAAVGQAPFLLPKSKTGTFHRFAALDKGAWDSVGMPVLVLQQHAAPLFPVLRRILQREAPHMAALLPLTTQQLRAGGLQAPALLLRTAFRNDPDLVSRVLDAIERPVLADLTPPQRAELRALVRAYAAPASQYFNLYGPPGTVQAIRYERLVVSKDLPDLRGKVIFIGLAEYGQPEQYEHFATVWPDRAGIDISGVELGATAYANLTAQQTIQPTPDTLRIALVAAMAALVCWICFLYTGGRALLVTVALICLYLAFALLLFEHRTRWLPVSAVTLLGTPLALATAFVSQYLELKHQYRSLYKVLGMFVPRGVVARLVNNAERLAWVRDSVHGACLATDGERYTALSDSMSPDQLGQFLNRYFQTLFPPVADTQGWVADVVGDSMLAVWSDTQPSAKVRERACLAALEIRAASERFNRDSTARMPTRIGVDFGPLSLTTIGAGSHWEYRPVGAVPNTANRLQSLNKKTGTQILVSAAAVEGLDTLLVRDLGWFMLRGKAAATRVVELLAQRALATDAQTELCERFSLALQRFQAGDLDAAGAQFEALTRDFGGDGPSSFFAGLCRQTASYVDGVVVVND